MSAELIRDVFLPAFQNPVLARLDDQAIVNVNGQRLAITTDSFVVKPLFFPGGDIGSLAVHGTINDLAMGGATPLFLSTAFIIEEGFSMDELRRVVNSLPQAAMDAGVQVVTGDTQVVEKGAILQERPPLGSAGARVEQVRPARSAVQLGRMLSYNGIV